MKPVHVLDGRGAERRVSLPIGPACHITQTTRTIKKTTRTPTTPRRRRLQRQSGAQPSGGKAVNLSNSWCVVQCFVGQSFEQYRATWPPLLICSGSIAIFTNFATFGNHLQGHEHMCMKDVCNLMFHCSNVSLYLWLAMSSIVATAYRYRHLRLLSQRKYGAKCVQQAKCCCQQ